MLLGIMKLPGADWAGHDIEIIKIVAVAGARRGIALGHQHHITVLDSHGLVGLPQVLDIYPDVPAALAALPAGPLREGPQDRNPAQLADDA